MNTHFPSKVTCRIHRRSKASAFAICFLKLAGKPSVSNERENDTANQQHLELLKQGAIAWNTWREEHPEIQPDLCSTSTQRVMLPHFDFSKFNLRRVALIGAELNKANFSEANLHGAGLLRAKLRGATFAGADLSNAVFTQADLSQANLDRADLSATKFTWFLANHISAIATLLSFGANTERIVLL